MGQVVGGRFEMGEPLGQGGMGMVYHGLDQQTGQHVAIKLLKPELVTANRDLVERFIREGEALRRLNHPNIVKMLALLSENDHYYLMMEYVSGGSLADLLVNERQLPVEWVLRITLELADALTRAHHLKIIHRDIKPANVLLAEDGTPRLTDFGIARLDDQSRMTESGLVVGTFGYLSPEACEGHDLDARTDIWSFGVMLYEMLAGRKPFEAETTAAIITSILMQAPPDLLTLRPDTPPSLANLINRMLQKDRNKRISSIRQVGAELESILQGNSAYPAGIGTTSSSEHIQPESRFATPTPSMEMDDTPTTIAPTPSPSTPTQGLKSSPPRRFLIAGGVVVLLVIAALALFASGVLRAGEAATPTTTAAISIASGNYLVLVAPFEAVKTDTRDVGRFIANDLNQHLADEVSYSKIQVAQYPTLITSDDEARAAAEAQGASVIIWGDYSADSVTANVQIGSLAAFKYNHFDRSVLERTANIRATMSDETKQSLVPQVLAVMGVLFNADGDIYGISRNWVVMSALKSVAAASVSDQTVSDQTYAFFLNYSEHPDQSVAALNQALNLDAGNALLYAFRDQAFYRTAAIKGSAYAPAITGELDKQILADATSAKQLGPQNWPLIPTLNYVNLGFDSYTSAIQLRPDDWYLYYLRAIAYPTQNRQTDLDKAITLKPDVSFPQMASAYLAMQQGRISDMVAQTDNIRGNLQPNLFFAQSLTQAQWQYLYNVFSTDSTGSSYRIATMYAALSKLIVSQYQDARDIIVQQATTGGAPDLLLLGIAQCGLGDMDKAQAAFKGITNSVYVMPHLFMAGLFLDSGNRDAAAQQVAFIQHSDQADLLAPFVAAVLNGDFGCTDLFNSQKVAEVMQKYGTVKGADLTAMLVGTPTNIPQASATP